MSQMQKSNWKGLSLTQDGASQRRGVVSFSGFSDLASPNRSGRDKINQYPFGIYRQHISENSKMLGGLAMTHRGFESAEGCCHGAPR